MLFFFFCLSVMLFGKPCCSDDSCSPTDEQFLTSFRKHLLLASIPGIKCILLTELMKSQMNISARTLSLGLWLVSISHTTLERICIQRNEGLNPVPSLPIENSVCMAATEKCLSISLSERQKVLCYLDILQTFSLQEKTASTGLLEENNSAVDTAPRN